MNQNKIVLTVLCILLLSFSISAYNSPYGSEYFYQEGGYEDAFGLQNYQKEYDSAYAFDSGYKKYSYEDSYVDKFKKHRSGFKSPTSGGIDYIKSFDRDEYDQYYYWYTNSYSDYEQAGINYRDYENGETYNKYVRPYEQYSGPATFYKYTYKKSDGPGYNSKPRVDEYESYEFVKDNRKFYNQPYYYQKPGASSGYNYHNGFQTTYYDDYSFDTYSYNNGYDSFNNYYSDGYDTFWWLN